MVKLDPVNFIMDSTEYVVSASPETCGSALTATTVTATAAITTTATVAAFTVPTVTVTTVTVTKVTVTTITCVFTLREQICSTVQC